MNTLVDRRVGEFLHDLSASTPTPGGGSASAAAGAMGAALLAMVAALPKTRSGEPRERELLDGSLRELAALRDQLASLIDRDAASYDAVTAAYRLPKGTNEQKARRSEAVRHALRGATEVPLQVMRACEAAAAHGVSVARHGSPSASSDTGVGLELLRAGLRGGALNVRINLGGLEDPAFAAASEAEVLELETSLERRLQEARDALSG